MSPGGRLVVLEDGEKFAAQHPSVANVVGEMGFELGDNGDEIRLYDRFGEPVTALVFDDAKPWPCTPDGFGRSLELWDSADPSLPESWFDGCIGGSPGEAYTACDENPIISEINYKSADAFDAGDWLELHNKSASALDLGGWEIRDGDDAHSFVIPLGTSLQAGGYLVFYEDDSKFSALFPQVTNKLGPLGFGLSGDGDLVRLYDAQGLLQMSVCYDDAAPWDEDADGFGYTLENSDYNGNQNNPNNWQSGCYGGSPGTVPGPDCVSATAGTVAETSVLVYPNPANEVLFVQLETGEAAKVRLVNMLGNVVLERSFTGSVELPISALATGVYGVEVVMDSRGHRAMPHAGGLRSFRALQVIAKP
ncbi:MAG: lamin tail domain-containing protein [Candidatus Competibacter sp.]